MKFSLTILLVVFNLLVGIGSAGIGEFKTSPDQSLTAPSGSQDLSTVGSPGFSYPELPSGGQYDGSNAAAYSMQPPPVAEQGAMMAYNAQNQPLTQIYFQGSYVPWTSFTNVRGLGAAYWVETATGWAWYATVPLGGWVRELMYLPAPGTVKVLEIYPTGLVQLYNFGYSSPGYKFMWFNGDTLGRHILLFTVGDTPSNSLVIDVVSSYPYGTGYQGGSNPLVSGSPFDYTGSSFDYTKKSTITYGQGFPSDGTVVTSTGGSTTFSSSGSDITFNSQR